MKGIKAANGVLKKSESGQTPAYPSNFCHFAAVMMPVLRKLSVSFAGEE